MRKQLIQGLHLVRDPENPKLVSLNTDKVYVWQITHQTKGTPKVGNLAVVETKKGQQHIIILDIVDAPKDECWHRAAIKFENRQTHHVAVQKQFEQYLAQYRVTK